MSRNKTLAMTQDELITKSDLEDFKHSLLREIRKMVFKSTSDEWLTGKEAKIPLKCGSTKLSELVRFQLIKSRGSGKGKKYSRKSLADYQSRIDN